MTDELFGLLSSSAKANIDPGTLELLGKQAASMHLKEGVPLNRAIVKLAQEQTGINSEQVRRIAEFANTAVHLAHYEKDKYAAQGFSYPQFALADPAKIIQDLSDGGSPLVNPTQSLDYGKPPEKVTKTSEALSDKLVSGMFPKTASVDYTRESVVAEVIGQKHNLEDLKQHLEHSGERFDLLHKQASQEFYDLVKNHILTGGSFSPVMIAARSTGVDGEKLASVIQPIVQSLLVEKIASPAFLKAGVNTMEKLAHRAVNPEHPMVKSFGAMVAFSDEMAKVAVALKEVDEGLNQINKFIKESFALLPALAAAKNVAGPVVGAAFKGAKYVKGAMGAAGNVKQYAAGFRPENVAASQGNIPVLDPTIQA